MALTLVARSAARRRDASGRACCDNARSMISADPLRKPTVSVVVPAYNVGPYIDEALATIDAQRYQPLETIVVDDGSTDRTAEIARRRADRVIAADHAGASRARNLGVAAARGELIAFLDADDLWVDGSLDRRVDCLVEDPEISFVLGWMIPFIDPHSPPPQRVGHSLVEQPRPAPMSTLVARAEVFGQVGPFDESLVVGEDADWGARANEAGCRGTCLEETVARKRVRPSGLMVRNAEALGPGLAQVLKASLDRRRAHAADGEA